MNYLNKLINTPIVAFILGYAIGTINLYVILLKG